MHEGVQAIFPTWPIASSSSHLTWLQSVGRSDGVRYCRWPRTDRVYGWLGRQLPLTQLGQTSSNIEQHGWPRSKYGWIEPKEVGLTKSHRLPLWRSISRASRGRFRRRLRTPKPVSTPSCCKMSVVVSDPMYIGS